MIVSGTIPVFLWGHKNEQVNTWPQATVHLVDETNKEKERPVVSVEWERGRGRFRKYRTPELGLRR